MAAPDLRRQRFAHPERGPGGAVAEPRCTPVQFGPGRGLLGLVTQAADQADPARPAVIILNAGLVHRVGPNRLHVSIARRLAQQGYTVLRFDLSGFGDSRPRHGASSYEEAGLADAQDAMSFLQSTRGSQSFALMGICSGADLALRVLARDERVAGALMIDSFAFDTPLYHLLAYGRRALVPASWKNLLRGDSDLLRRVVNKARGFVDRQRGIAPAEQSAPGVDWRMPPREEILHDMAVALGRRAAIALVYSGGPAYYNYLTNLSLPYFRLPNRDRLEVHRFLEADHTFTLHYHQGLLLKTVEEWATQAL